MAIRHLFETQVPWGGWNQTVDMDDLPATPPHQGVWLEESWSQDPWTVTADGLADLLGANGIVSWIRWGSVDVAT